MNTLTRQRGISIIKKAGANYITVKSPEAGFYVDRISSDRKILLVRWLTARFTSPKEKALTIEALAEQFPALMNEAERQGFRLAFRNPPSLTSYAPQLSFVVRDYPTATAEEEITLEAAMGLMKDYARKIREGRG